MQSGIYRHYGGEYYLVLGVGQNEKNGEMMVAYVSLNATLPGPRLRFRALEGPDGWNVPVHLTPESAQQRFTYIGDECPHAPEATWG